MKKTEDNAMGILTYESDQERVLRGEFLELFKRCPIPQDQIMSNLAIFLNSKTLARILFMDYIYRQILDVQGVVMELGTRWGQNLSLFAALRGIYEPFNRHRKIIGFDTFEGFLKLANEDGNSVMMKQGELSCTEGYEKYLEEILAIQESDNPLGHIRKFDIQKGDAVKCLATYLEAHPETIVALAYFDFDLYEPTRDCLSMIRPRLVKGSVLGFDELNDPDSPGETKALMEVFGLPNIRLRRYHITSRVSYFVVE